MRKASEAFRSNVYRYYPQSPVDIVTSGLCEVITHGLLREDATQAQHSGMTANIGIVVGIILGSCGNTEAVITAFERKILNGG